MYCFTYRIFGDIKRYELMRELHYYFLIMAKGKGGDDGCGMLSVICCVIMVPGIILFIGVNNYISGNTRIQRIEEYSIYFSIYIIDIIHALKNGLIMV